VIGGGPAGVAAAIALAETGAKTALIARRAPNGDNRTTALLGGSVDLLNSWRSGRLQGQGRAIADHASWSTDTGRLIARPRSVFFRATRIGSMCLATTSITAALMAALEERARSFPL